MNLKQESPPSVEPCMRPGRRAKRPTWRMQRTKSFWKITSHRGPRPPTNGAKIPRYQKETKICKIQTKTLRGKPKERVEKYQALQLKWKQNKKNVVKQVLDGASDAKCQIDAEMIEATYAEWFESISLTVDLSNYPGPFTEPPVPPTTSEKDSGTHKKQSSQTRQAEPSCNRILDVVTASEVRKAVRAVRTGSAGGPDRITVLKLKRKAEETPGFLAGVYTLWLMTGRVPEKLKASRSLLLPKGTTDMLNTCNLRPLSISSVLLRLYMKILAKRPPPFTARLHSCSRSQTKLGSTRAPDMKTEEGKGHPSCGIPGPGESL